MKKVIAALIVACSLLASSTFVMKGMELTPEQEKAKARLEQVDKELANWRKECQGVKRIAYPFRKCGQNIIKLELERTGLLKNIGKSSP